MIPIKICKIDGCKFECVKHPRTGKYNHAICHKHHRIGSRKQAPFTNAVAAECNRRAGGSKAYAALSRNERLAMRRAVKADFVVNGIGDGDKGGPKIRPSTPRLFPVDEAAKEIRRTAITSRTANPKFKGGKEDMIYVGINRAVSNPLEVIVYGAGDLNQLNIEMRKTNEKRVTPVEVPWLWGTFPSAEQAVDAALLEFAEIRTPSGEAFIMPSEEALLDALQGLELKAVG